MSRVFFRESLGRVQKSHVVRLCESQGVPRLCARQRPAPDLEASNQILFALGSSDVYFSRTISTPQRKSGYFPSFKSDTPFDHASDTAQGVPSLVAHRACHLAQGDRVQASASNAGRLVPNHVVLNRAEFLYTSAI